MRALQAQHAEMGSLLAADAGQQPAQMQGPAAFAAAAGGGIAVGAGRVAPRGPAPPSPPPAQAEASAPFVRGERKVGRNEPCPCGSGKKYKHCHGALSSVE